MKVWYLSDVKSYKLMTNTQEETQDNQAIAFGEQTFTVEIPQTDYIKAKITMCNIAPSDVSAYLGKTKKYPIVPGRSAIALVSESNFPAYKQGQRIFLSPYENCENGNFKTRGVEINGYMGDYILTPLSCIYTLPEGITDEEVLFIEDIALAVKVLEKLAVDKAQYIALYGASYINNIIAQLAIYYQTIPIMIDNDEDRLNMAQNCGIYYTVNTGEENVLQKIIEITSGKLADNLIIDADNFTNIDDMTGLIKKKGKMGLFGYNKYLPNINCNLSKVVANQITVIGINNGNDEIHTAINMLANKIITTNGFIKNTVNIENFPDLMKEMSINPSFMKNIVKCF